MPLYEYQCMECQGINTHYVPSIDATPLGELIQVRCIFCEEYTQACRMISVPARPPMNKEEREGKWKEEDGKIKHAKRVIEKQRAEGQRPEFGKDEGFSLDDVRKGRVPDSL